VISGTGPQRAPGLRWTVWVAALVVYTYLLLAPDPWLPTWLRTTVGHKVTTDLSVGKFAHGVMYGALTLWTFMLPVGRFGWLICVLILSLHGFGTEFVQLYVPGRHGRWQDVGIDHVGIALGLMLGGVGCWLTGRCCRPAGQMPAASQMDGDAGHENGDARPL